MNKINQLFGRKNKDILSVFFTAGFPELDDTPRIISALDDNDIDMVEIGIPYSDPVADGPVIEQSSVQALKNGMSLHLLFEQLHRMDTPNGLPMILMGYLNPVMQYGYEKFCKEAADCGISGLILPDLPPEVFSTELKPFVEKYGLHFIFLITPETPEERIRMIDNMSTGFIYAVSSSSVTGRDTDESKKEEYLKRIHSYHLKNPILVGFGVKDHKTFQQACRYTNGAISGTAFINAISDSHDFDKTVKKFSREMKEGEEIKDKR